MIEYMQRTRAYYGALGYPAYAWAANEPMERLATVKPLSECRLALVSTAAPYQQGLGDQGPGAPYNAAAKFFSVFTAPLEPAPDLRISHIGYDRVHCRAEDPNTWLPVAALQRARDRGVIGDLARELIGLPTHRSQRRTVEDYAPTVREHITRLEADVALLVPT